MSQLDSIETSTNPYAKQFLVFFMSLAILILLSLYLQAFESILIPLTYILPLSLAYGIVLGIMIYRKAIDPLPITPFVLGFLFMAGGAALDGIATLVNSPTLDREGNPISRVLLDSGHSVSFVIAYGILAQVLWVILICILWAAFLKHKNAYLALVKEKNARSGWDFIKAALGGAHLSWRQFLLPLKIKEFPTSYYWFWMFPVLFVGISLHRWYLGFVWMGMINFSSFGVALISSVLAFVAYLVWLLQVYSKEIGA